MESSIIFHLDRCAPFLPLKFCRIFFNKPVARAEEMFTRFIDKISPENLFIGLPDIIRLFFIIGSAALIFSLLSRLIRTNEAFPKSNPKRGSKYNPVHVIILTIIVLLAFSLRIYNLTGLPPGFTKDEISIGYNAFTLAQKGIDQDGRKFPLTHFRSLGDYKLPLTMYVVAITQKVIPDHFLSIRLPSVIAGTATVFTTYLLARLLFSSATGLVAALLLALSPWHLFHSRLGLETNIALFFSTLALFFLFLSRKNQNHLFLSALFGVLTLYTHHAYWVFLPAIVVGYTYLHRRYYVEKIRKTTLICLFIVLLSLLPFTLGSNAAAATRKNQSILSTVHLAAQRETSKSFCRENIFCQYITTAGTLSNIFARHYLSAFSFLSWYTGTAFDPVDVAPNHGLFYPVELLLIVIGIAYAVKHKERSAVLLWLMVFPLPIAVTYTLSAARMYQLLPLPQLVEAYGLTMIFKKNRFWGIAICALLLFSFIRFELLFSFSYPYAYSRQADYGYLAINTLISAHPSDTIIIRENLYDRLNALFLRKILPTEIKIISSSDEDAVTFRDGNLMLVDRDFIPPPNPRVLYISSKEEIPKNYTHLESVILKDGSSYAFVSRYR